MTSESTRFLGQPNEIKPTEGAVGVEVLVTYLLYRGCGFRAGNQAAHHGFVRAGLVAFMAGYAWAAARRRLFSASRNSRRLRMGVRIFANSSSE